MNYRARALHSELRFSSRAFAIGAVVLLVICLIGRPVDAFIHVLQAVAVGWFAANAVADHITAQRLRKEHRNG